MYNSTLVIAVYNSTLVIPLITQSHGRFEDMNKSDEETVEHEAGITDSFMNPRTIMKYMNPAEWFKGKMSTTEAIVMSVIILATLVLLLVLIKIFSCCSCIVRVVRKICCCTREMEKSENVRRNKSKQDSSEYKVESKKVGFSGKAISMI